MESLIDDKILDKSLCTENEKEKAYLKEIMGGKKFKTVLYYRGSRDGWNAEDFHRTSDGKGPTISLFKVQDNGYCIGGFTTVSWSSADHQDCGFGKDSSAMLFNLTTHHCFTPTNPSFSVRLNKAKGPNFGENSLYAEEPFNEDQKIGSMIHKTCYNNVKDGQNIHLLTGTEGQKFRGMLTKFTISELEVWGVIMTE